MRRMIILLMLGHLTNNYLLTRPVNEFGIVNLVFGIKNCSSDIGSNAITWFFTLFDTTNNVTVAVGGTVSQGYTNMFRIDQPNSYASNLIISESSNRTAGTYTCSDTTEVASAQFSVGTNIFSSSGNVSNNLKNGDVFYCSCSGSFYGNDFITPQFYVYNVPELPKYLYILTTPEITKQGSLRVATGTVIDVAKCGILFQQAQFDVRYSAPKGNLPSGSATNAPQHGWTTSFFWTINVSCVPADLNMTINGPTAGNLIQYGENISCNVISSTPVNYTWTDFTYGNSSNGQQLRIWHNGTYQCNASTEQDGKKYSASKALYIMIVLPVKNVPTDDKMNISGQTADNLVQFGDTITCSVPSSTQVNYTWTDFTYGNKSKGQQLRVWHNGTYQCNASTEQDGKTYTASKTLYNLIVLPVKKIVLTASPLFGPIAGGTKITFTFDNWSDTIWNISAVYIGGYLSAAIVNLDKKKQLLVVISPAASDDLIQQSLKIIIELTPEPFNLTTELYFIYRSNPEITGLSPNSFIVTGGTSLNVTGSSLSSVVDPQIQVTLSVSRVNATENFSQIRTDSCRVESKEGTNMICNMPPVDIPKDFLNILDSGYHSNETASKMKATSNVLEVTGPNGYDIATVYLGFILDGYQKYKNINNVLPDTQISFYSSPEINSSTNVYEYDSGSEGLFLIQGKRLALGCRMSDYVVRVGNAICQNVDLQDNALTVRLPKTEPQFSQNETVICGENFNVRIVIGYKEYHYCCLKYKSSYTILIIALCVGVGGFLLLTITIIGVLVCCRKHQRKSNNHNRERQHSLETVDNFYEGSKGFSKTNDGYRRTID